jgi:hypothetical protein
MSTDCVAKLYERLTPRERLPLIFAASARGDEVDRARLIASAPRNDFLLPDYFGLAEGMRTLAFFHAAEMLDLAARYWRASGMVAREDDTRCKAGNAEQARWLDAARMLAYLFVVNADGWSRFCSDMRVDADLLLKKMPGYHTLISAEEVARGMAFTSEEATAYVCGVNRESVEALTTGTVVASLREFLELQADRWG